MRQGLYVLIDLVAARIVGTVMQERNDDVAIRTFDDAAKQDGGFIAKHIEDFELRRVGFVDDETGLVSLDPHDQLATGSTTILTGKQWKSMQPVLQDVPGRTVDPRQLNLLGTNGR